MKKKPIVVMFARNEDVLAAKWDKNFDEVSKRGVSLIDVNDIEKFKKDFKISDDSLVHQDSIFIAHPYTPNTYVNIEDSDSIIQRDKFNKTALIAHELGVIEFIVKSVNEKQEKVKTEINVKGSVEYIDVSSDVINKSSSDDRYYLGYKYSYNGKKPDYIKAKQMLVDFGLEADPDINSMVEMRNPQKENLLTRQQIKLKVSSEFNKSLDVASRLSVMGGMLNLSADYNKQISIRTSVEIVVDIRF